MLLVFKNDDPCDTFVLQEDGRELYCVRSTGFNNFDTAVISRGNLTTVHTLVGPTQAVKYGVPLVDAGSAVGGSSGKGVEKEKDAEVATVTEPEPVQPMMPKNEQEIIARIEYKMKGRKALENKGRVQIGEQGNMDIKAFLRSVGWFSKCVVLS